MKRLLSFFLVFSLVLSAAAVFARGAQEDTEEVVERESFVPDDSLVSGMVVLEEGVDPVYGGTLNIALPAITHLDPVSIAGDTEPYILIFETLFEFDPDWNPTPLLVETVDVSEDGLTHTWKLREGIKFHDGSDFNADVVKWNIDRKIEQDTPLAQSIPWSANPVKVVNEYTVEVTLREPSFVMYNYLSSSSWMMYSREFVESVTPDDLKNRGIGTGPFVIKEYFPNDYLVLERNREYWQKGVPFFDEVNIKIIPDANTRLLMLEAGEVDFVKDLSIQDLNRLKNNPKVLTRTAASTRTYHVAPHNQRPPFDNINVRKALNYAVDKEMMNKTIFEGTYNISTGLSTSYVTGFKGNDPYPYDPDEAMRLLDGEGLVDTNGDGFREWQGQETEFVMYTRAGQRPGDVEIAEQFQAFMAEVGLNVRVEIIESGQFFAILRGHIGEGRQPAYHFSNQAPANFSGDMSFILEALYSTWAWPPNLFNDIYYSNAEVDALIKAGNVAGSLEERDEYYAKAQDIIWDEAATVWLLDGILSLGTSPNLRGIFGDGAHNVWVIKYAWFDK